MKKERHYDEIILPSDERIGKILDVILAYARLDFSAQIPISDYVDDIDAISAGVNMLGEELRFSYFSLKEKQIMLREIHHRLKNNMQVISSLLNLLANSQTDKKFLSLLKDTQSRIKSMAIIHEMLYATTDFKYTNLLDYITKLISALNQSYAPPGNKVKYAISVDGQVSYDIDKMIPLGLIINEIICNSLKYAFPDGSNGIISVDFMALQNKHKLIITDNGIGLPENFVIEKSESLGMQLIFILAEQINAKIEVMKNNEEGLKYVIKIIE